MTRWGLPAEERLEGVVSAVERVAGQGEGVAGGGCQEILKPRPPTVTAKSHNFQVQNLPSPHDDFKTDSVVLTPSTPPLALPSFSFQHRLEPR